jgi:hypothetical protein
MPNAHTDVGGEIESTDTTVAVQCPHCVAAGKEDWKTWVAVDRKDFNCKIFRHGIMREPYVRSGQIVPIPPHAPKELCDQLAAAGTIIGCGKPYRLVVVQVQPKVSGVLPAPRQPAPRQVDEHNVRGEAPCVLPAPRQPAPRQLDEHNVGGEAPRVLPAPRQPAPRQEVKAVICEYV